MTKSTNDYFYNLQLVTELYETKYGICDHINNINPLASVQLNDSEKYLDNNLYEAYLQIYLNKKVYSLLGISFDDFINRPRYELTTMLKVINTFNNKTNEVTEDIINNLAAQNKKFKENM